MDEKKMKKKKIRSFQDQTDLSEWKFSFVAEIEQITYMYL